MVQWLLLYVSTEACQSGLTYLFAKEAGASNPLASSNLAASANKFSIVVYMKNLFEINRVNEIKDRLNILSASSGRQWGTMTSAQMLAHCSLAMKMSLGDIRPPRMFLGRMIGFLIKPLVLGNDEPMRKNSPTVKGFAVGDDRDFEAERIQLIALIDRFYNAGSSGIESHTHSFFGKLAPDEWAILMYKHLDHHLRQFGV